MRIVAVLVTLWAVLVVQGDILHLRDGSRYYGTLISQNEREVVFRAVLADGSSGAVRNFPRSQVKWIERSAPPRPPGPGKSGQEPATSRPAEDFEQMLREAFELLDDNDRPAACRALQRLVLRAPPDVLAQLDRRTRAARDIGLAELLAKTRILTALARGGGRAFRLTFATHFEGPALGRLLERWQTELLAERHEQRTIAQWAAEPGAYTELRPGARRMVADARFAAAVISARLKFDPRLRSRGEQRRRLVALRDDLARFAARVMSLRGYTGLGGAADERPDPAARAVAWLRAGTRSASPSPPAQEEKHR